MKFLKALAVGLVVALIGMGIAASLSGCGVKPQPLTPAQIAAIAPNAPARARCWWKNAKARSRAPAAMSRCLLLRPNLKAAPVGRVSPIPNPVPLKRPPTLALA